MDKKSPSPSQNIPNPTPFRRSDTQQLFKSKHVTLLPNVAGLINTCKAKQMEYRILFEGEPGADADGDGDGQLPESERKSNRLTIVVANDGNLVRKYVG